MSKLTLEKRIADALNNNIAAIDLAALLAETEAAITQASTVERKMALDPTLSPDPTAARAAMTDAEFMANRLRTLLPRLQKRYTDVEAAEALTSWQSDRDRVEVRRNQAANKFMKCRDLIAEMVAIFTEVEEVDHHVNRINSSSPPGQRTLQGCELTARNLASFSSSDRSIVATTQLFSFDGKQVWPPRRPSIATIMAPPPQHDPRFSADWATARSGADAVKKEPGPIQREQQRIADYYREETRLQHERQQREAEEVLAARQRSA